MNHNASDPAYESQRQIAVQLKYLLQERRESRHIDIISLEEEAKETIYPNEKEAEEIALQLANVLGYCGAKTLPLRYLRGRILVTYWYPSNWYMEVAPIRYVSPWSQHNQTTNT